MGPVPRVHLRVHEDLEPDRLRELARPGVTLWLSTRSNTLRASTMENVGRFDAAWVQLRAPLAPFEARAFSKLPTTGVMLGLESLDVVGRLPGARRVALALKGPLDEATVAKVRAARPSELRWTPEGGVDLLSWGQFSQLPGRRVIVATPDTCCP